MNNKSISTGLKALAVISLIFDAIGLASLVFVMRSKELFQKYLSEANLTEVHAFISIAICVVSIIALFLILKVKLIGVHLYVLATIAGIIFTAIISGLTVSALLKSILLPAILLFFVYLNKDAYAAN